MHKKHLLSDAHRRIIDIGHEVYFSMLKIYQYDSSLHEGPFIADLVGSLEYRTYIDICSVTS